MQRFGEKLRALRRSQGMTLAEFAMALGFISPSYMSELETGKQKPSLEFVVKVSRRFNITTDQLLKEELELDQMIKPTANADDAQYETQRISGDQAEKEPLQRLGEKVRALRTRRSMTVRDLAKALDYASHSYINDVEHGNRRPSADLVLKLSLLFSVSADVLLRDDLELPPMTEAPL